MNHRSAARSRRSVALALTTGAVLATASALSAGAAQAAPAPAPAGAPASAYTGDAYGSTVNVGSVVKSGHSAPVVLGCGTKAGVSRSNTSAGLNVPLLASSGTVATTATTAAGPSTATTTARTESLSLLGGMVTADAVESSSATSRTGTGFSTSDAGTTFVNLQIAHQGMPASAPANTKVTLPGVGYIVLNEQVVTNTAKAASLTVNALHLVVTNSLPIGPPNGLNVVVSHARSGLSAPVAGVLGGNAYGSRVNLASVISSGATFQRTMPCLGTGGVERATTGAALDLSPAIHVGAVRNTVDGTVDDSTASGETTSTIDSTDLLGVLSATAIRADAHASLSGTGVRSLSDAGSTFGTLSVMGQTMGPDVPKNTVIAVPNVGTLYLHRVVKVGAKVEVRMIELVLVNPMGALPAGTDIRIGVAAASVSGS